MEIEIKILNHFKKKNEKGGKPARLNIKIKIIKFNFWGRLLKFFEILNKWSKENKVNIIIL